MVDHTYNQEGNKCVCGQAEPKKVITDTLTISWETLGLTTNGSFGAGSKSITSAAHNKSVTIAWTQAARQKNKESLWLQVATSKVAGELHNSTAFPGRIVSIELKTFGEPATKSNASTVTFGTSENPTGNSQTATYSAVGDTQTIKTGDQTNFTYFKIDQGKAAAYFESIIITFEVPQ